MKRAEYVLALTAWGAVLAFGGVQPVAYSLMGMVVAALALVVFWKGDWPALSLPAASVLGLVTLIPLVQILPLPSALTARLSPARVALENELLGPWGAASAWVPVTVNRHATTVAALKLVCYALVFLLAFLIYRKRQRSALIGMLTALGLFQAAYGMVQYLAGWHYIFTYRKVYFTDVASGTYIDRNHYAGLLDMVLPFVLAGILLRLPRPGGRSGGAGWAELARSATASRISRDIVLFSIICAGLIFSRSRMGITAGLVGVTLVMVIAFLPRRRRAVLVIAILALALTGAYGLWIGLGPVIERFRVGSFEHDRLPFWRDTVALIRDYPLLGTGLGTYRWASLHYQTTMLHTYYEHAHNDYLEFAADIGIPAAVLLFGSLWVLAVKAARRALTIERTEERILAAGCAGAMVAILTHEITEFNLQMPANAFILAWIAGTAAALVGERGHAVAAGSSRARP